MAYIGTCNACRMGDHKRHEHIVQPAPEGGFGGVVCDCKGDCKPETIEQILGMSPGQFKRLSQMIAKVDGLTD